MLIMYQVLRLQRAEILSNNQPMTHLWSLVQLQYPEAHILNVLLRHTKDAEPCWHLGQ